MKLTSGWGIEIRNPTRQEIEQVLMDMPVGENSFVLLEKETKFFIQAAGRWQCRHFALPRRSRSTGPGGWVWLSPAARRNAGKNGPRRAIRPGIGGRFSS